jgi:small subunit ribosomal protein S10
MKKQKIKLRLKAFDHRLLDRSVDEIVKTVKRSGGNIQGPIPMPKKIRRFTVNRSSHIDFESREQFEIRTHERLIYIVDPSPQDIESLNKLDLPPGVEVEIKLLGDR